MNKVYYNQLEFLYNLTNLNQYLNHKGLSKKLKVITPQTIQNWFASFKKQKFKYYHSLNLEKLGLTNIFTINDNPELHNYRNSIQEIYNPSNFKKSKLAHYIVPLEKLKDFNIKGQQYYTNFNIYPPYHKLLSSEKKFHYTNLKESNFEKQLSSLENYIRNIKNIKPTNILKKEPLILPLAFESKNSIYSVDIWNSIKNKLNDNNGYINVHQSNQQGIKKVQKTIKLLNTELNHLVQQTDIDYPQLLSGTQAVLFLVKYNNIKKLKSLVSNILIRSAKTSIYPNKKDVMVRANMNLSEIKDILETPLKIKSFFLGNCLEENTFNYGQSYNPVKRTWN